MEVNWRVHRFTTALQLWAGRYGNFYNCMKKLKRAPQKRYLKGNKKIYRIEKNIEKSRKILILET